MKKKAEITYLPEAMQKHMTPDEIQLMSDLNYGDTVLYTNPTAKQVVGTMGLLPLHVLSMPASLIVAACTPTWDDKKLRQIADDPVGFAESNAVNPILGPYREFKYQAARNALTNRAYERARQQKKAADNLYRAEFPGPDGLLVTPPKSAGPLNHDAMLHIHKVMQLVRSLPKTHRDNVATFTYGKGGIGNLATSFDQAVQDKYDANEKEPQI